VERLAKLLEDADKRLVQCMQQIKDIAVEKELRDKELEELKTTAQVVVDMVDAAEEGVVDSRTLVEQLRQVPQKIASYISETTREYVARVLSLVKSYCLRPTWCH